jgi:hypothetical protein
MTVKPLATAFLVLLLLSLVNPRAALAQAADAGVAPADAPADPAAEKKAEARIHFDLGVSHFDREEWQAALVEFLAGRQIFPTKGNTKNAAICLRKVGRFAESLDMFEALVRDFPGLLPGERALADREIAELRASVGTLDIRDAPEGASVTVDGVDQGKTPIKAPLRLSAGNHSIRVVKDGYLPFETRKDLAGREAAIVHAQLAPLTQAGRLTVSEKAGKALDIVVDGSVAGRTPSWEGALAPGPHVVLLRGDGNLGTQPVSVDVKVNQAVALDLEAEELRASLSVTPTPMAAIVTLDGVDVAHGPWTGRLRAGLHKIGVRLDGFLPQLREITLANDAKENVDVMLESAATPGRSGLQFEIDGAVPIGLLYGGELSSACAGSCSAGVPVGVAGLFHASYRFPSGWGIGLHAGYMTLGRSLKARAATLTPVGKAPVSGLAFDDDLSLRGLRVGPHGEFDTAGDWPVTLRLGTGVFLGSLKDTRSGGPFLDSKGAQYNVSTTFSSAATYLYVAPEVRLGRRFGENFELNIGVELLVMAALTTPAWDPLKTVNTGPNDGNAQFQGQKLTGDIVISALPGVGAKLQF